MIKLVIFDLDGLLLDSERQMWIPNEVKATQKFGYEYDEAFFYTIMGTAPSTSKKMFHDKFGDDFDMDTFYQEVYKLNAESVDRGDVTMKDGAQELLDYLDKDNIKYCIGSSSYIEYVHQVLKKLNIFDKFEQVITRNDVEKAKPHPDIYLKCMEGYKPEECLVLEDAHSGLLASNAADCRCILVPDIGVLSKDDYQQAYRVVNNLRDVIDIIKEENETAVSF